MSMTKNLKNGLIVSLFLLTIATAVNAKTIYVDADRPPGGGGTNWADAYKYLQDALADAYASAKPVEIRVAQGTYYPDEGAGVTDGVRTETFQLINDVTLKGGYAGYGEPDPDAWDVTAYETILSGDLNGNDVSVSDPCDLLNHPNRAENSYHVVTGTSTNATAVLDGFTITAGNANGTVNPNRDGAGMINSFGGVPTVLNCTFSANSSNLSGGGMYCYDTVGSGPAITNCSFTRNYSDGGGGIYTHAESAVLITDCTFTGNQADSGGGIFTRIATLTNCTFSGNLAISGGGVAGVEDITLIKCAFTDNQAVNYGGGLKFSSGSLIVVDCIFNNNHCDFAGGAIDTMLHSGQTSKITNCTFSGNSAGSHGGAYYGGMFIWGGSQKLTNCTFVSNSAFASGGGLGIVNAASILSNCMFAGNSAWWGGGMYSFGNGKPRLTNSTFVGNSAGKDGGAIYTTFVPGYGMTVINCTFSGNEASSDGGGFGSSHDYSKFSNCTFSENSAGGDGGGFSISTNGGTPDFNNCVLWGNTANNEGPQMAIKTASATVTVNYSDVQGGWLDIYVSAGTLNYDASNIESDPLFVDADGADDTVGTEDDNLRLLADSNCIDAGDNSAVPADTADLDGDANTAEPIPLDLNGFPRFIDDLCTTDTGSGTAPIVDMGAYEFLRSDIDRDGDVNFKDFSQFALFWQDVACGACSGADLTCDGDVNAYDLKELADNWLSKQ